MAATRRDNGRLQRYVRQSTFSRFYRFLLFSCPLRCAAWCVDANVILAPSSTAENPAVVGVIDFGDCVHTWRVNELAIGMAYSMVSSWGKEEGNHIHAAGALLRGYLSSSPPLDPREVMRYPSLPFSLKIKHRPSSKFCSSASTGWASSRINRMSSSVQLYFRKLFILAGPFQRVPTLACQSCRQSPRGVVRGDERGYFTELPRGDKW
jgi:hypothetical protein